MRRIFAILLCGLALQAAGCVGFRAPVIPPSGFIFSHWKAPLSTNFDGTPSGGKVGADFSYYLREPIFKTSYAWRHADIANAMKKAGITTLYYADYEVVQVLGMFCQFKVIVHGD